MDIILKWLKPASLIVFPTIICFLILLLALRHTCRSKTNWYTLYVWYYFCYLFLFWKFVFFSVFLFKETNEKKKIWKEKNKYKQKVSDENKWQTKLWLWNVTDDFFFFFTLVGNNLTCKHEIQSEVMRYFYL